MSYRIVLVRVACGCNITYVYMYVYDYGIVAGVKFHIPCMSVAHTQRLVSLIYLRIARGMMHAVRGMFWHGRDSARGSSRIALHWHGACMRESAFDIS